MTAKSDLSNFSEFPGDASRFLTSIPCPAGLWNEDRSLCLFNVPAITLFGLGDTDFVDMAHSWMRQIHADDRNEHKAFLVRVGSMPTPLACDYRFSPKGANGLIWLREVSAPVIIPSVDCHWKVSTYTEISDLKAWLDSNAAAANLDDIIEDLFHDTQNNIHRLGMEIELTRMGVGSASETMQTSEMIKRLEDGVRDLRGYINSTPGSRSACDAVEVLDGLVTNSQIGNLRRRMKVTWIPPESLPLVSTHRKLLARVLERILDFCETLLQRGGELRIAAGRQNSDGAGPDAAEIRLVVKSAVPLPSVQDRELFGNFAEQSQSNPGLRRAVEVLRRQQGQISFRIKDERQWEINIRLKSHPGKE